MSWDWIFLLSVITMFLVVVFLLLLYSPSRVVSEYRFEGLLWCVDRKSHWRPCCEECLSPYTFRPVDRSREGIQYYELICPVCGRSFLGRAFTLQDLMELEGKLTAALKRPWVRVPHLKRLSHR